MGTRGRHGGRSRVFSGGRVEKAGVTSVVYGTLSPEAAEKMGGGMNSKVKI